MEERIREEKQQLRLRTGLREAEMSPEELRSSDREIVEKLMSLPEFIQARTLMLYMPFRREVDIREAVYRALEQGKEVGFPVVLPGRKMCCRRWTGGPMQQGVFRIPVPGEDEEEIAPDRLEFILVPAVCYDARGARLGRGAGYYDRFLKSTGAVKAGLCREALMAPRVPEEEHDCRVDIIITERRILRLCK
jgi:5-formyltetrahydrofolate cyclo-ligase